MEVLANTIFFTFVIVCGASIFIGLNLKQWFSWLFGVYGFLSGFLVGLLRNDLSDGIGMGALFAFIILYGGATSYWHRKRYK